MGGKAWVLTLDMKVVVGGMTQPKGRAGFPMAEKTEEQ